MVRCMIHFKHKLIYIHIPKTGGTSIEMALTGYQDKDGTDRLLRSLRGVTTDEFHIAYRRSSSRHLPYSYYRAYVEDMLDAKIDDYTVFTSIRNPWARTISAYNYWQEHRPADLSHTPTFFKLRRCYIPDIARNLFGLKMGILAYVVCTADENLRDPINIWLENNSVDHMLRCESLDDDFTAMCDSLGLSVILETYNTSRNVIYQEHFNWFSRWLVGLTHRKTIKRFDYHFE